MHAGQVVEVAPVRSLFRHPAHPYTRALVRSIPRVDREIVDGADRRARCRRSSIAPPAAAMPAAARGSKIAAGGRSPR